MSQLWSHFLDQEVTGQTTAQPNSFMILVLSLFCVVVSSYSSVDEGVEVIAEVPFLNLEDVAELSADAVVQACVT